MGKNRTTKDGGPTKASAIRELLASDPKMKTSALIESLKSKGIKVSSNHVYLIKSKLKGRKRRQTRERAAAASKKIGMTNPAQAVLDVRALALRLGGMKNLKTLVDVLAE